MNTTTITTTLSKGAQNYIDSLVQQGKIFTTKTVLKWFPKENVKDITSYATAAVKGQKYITVTDSASFIPSTMFANNAAEEMDPMKISSNNSVVSGTKKAHVSLTSTMVSKLKLSARSYRYSIKGMNITIHRDSQNTSLDSFTVWSNGKAVIPVPSMGEYTVTLK